MSKKTFGMMSIIAGAVLTILSLFADGIGIGSNPGFHYAQIIGVVIGLAAIVFGFVLQGMKFKEKK